MMHSIAKTAVSSVDVTYWGLRAHRNLEELVDNAVKLFGPWAVAGGATSDTEPTVAQFRDDEPGGVASGTLGSQLKQEEQSESGARVIWSYSLSVVSLLSLACNYS